MRNQNIKGGKINKFNSIKEYNMSYQDDEKMPCRECQSLMRRDRTFDLGRVYFVICEGCGKPLNDVHRDYEEEVVIPFAEEQWEYKKKQIEQYSTAVRTFLEIQIKDLHEDRLECGAEDLANSEKLDLPTSGILWMLMLLEGFNDRELELLQYFNAHSLVSLLKHRVRLMSFKQAEPLTSEAKQYGRAAEDYRDCVINCGNTVLDALQVLKNRWTPLTDIDWAEIEEVQDNIEDRSILDTREMEELKAMYDSLKVKE